MRSFLISLFLIVGLCLGGAAEGPARLHPYLQTVLAQAGDETFSVLSLAPRIKVFPQGEKERIGVLVKLRHPIDKKSFLELPVETSTGTIITMHVTLAELLSLAGSPDVLYVEPAWRTEPKLDLSLPAIGVDRLHRWSPPLLGEGVIIGAVDTGIDYSHLDFRYDDDGDGLEESSRILSIWDQTSGWGGTYYTNAQIEGDILSGFGPGQGQVRQSDTDGHGTHVMGIAAGDGSSCAAGLVGVAPKADIVMVKTTFYTSDIIDGVDYIFTEAESHGMPAVVNLSLGGHTGPHDGTSLFEQGLDELADEPGRVIIVSAGNEGDQHIHFSGVLENDSASFSVEPFTSSIELELWYPGDASFSITVTAWGKSLTVQEGQSSMPSLGGSEIRIDNASGGANPNNGDKQALINLTGLIPYSNFILTVTDAGGGGRFDGWITTASGGRIIEGDGDATHTIDEPGNARRAITVGAFNTKAHWDSIAGTEDFSSEYPVGELTYFSSRGPTRDGRQKPDLSAPGAWVASALSADCPWIDYITLTDSAHRMGAGTSVSASHVTGVSALILSQDPNLSGEEIKDILAQNADSDNLTGIVPNSLWGHGKMDAYESLSTFSPAPDEGPEYTASIGVTENPVHSRAIFTYELYSGTTQAELLVYNVTGRLMFKTQLNTEGGQYEWGLETTTGEPLATGLYLYLVRTEAGRSATGLLVIQR
ncbi:MAG: S8 family serine peptidase [Candidatus Bipolaricaulota bacterium]|nr:S8 family serine peptidase [Candidatus Bipolaricaulota bacterium]